MLTSETSPPPADDNQLMAERRDKLAAMRQQGIAFPNDIKPKHRAAQLFEAYGSLSKEELAQRPVTVSVAGRMMLKRVM
ncbi:MAG: lysine--tRNA ligase, partial [Betaproteobacteria bacterium]